MFLKFYRVDKRKCFLLFLSVLFKSIGSQSDFPILCLDDFDAEIDEYKLKQHQNILNLISHKFYNFCS